MGYFPQETTLLLISYEGQKKGTQPFQPVLPSHHLPTGGEGLIIPAQPNPSPSPRISPLSLATERSLQCALCWVWGRYKTHPKWPLPSPSLGYSWKGQATQRNKSKLELSQQRFAGLCTRTQYGQEVRGAPQWWDLNWLCRVCQTGSGWAFLGKRPL